MIRRLGDLRAEMTPHHGKQRFRAEASLRGKTLAREAGMNNPRRRRDAVGLRCA